MQLSFEAVPLQIAPKQTLHEAPGKPRIGLKWNIGIDMHLPCCHMWDATAFAEGVT